MLKKGLLKKIFSSTISLVLVFMVFTNLVFAQPVPTPPSTNADNAYEAIKEQIRLGYANLDELNEKLNQHLENYKQATSDEYIMTEIDKMLEQKIRIRNNITLAAKYEDKEIWEKRYGIYKGKITAIDNESTGGSLGKASKILGKFYTIGGCGPAMTYEDAKGKNEPTREQIEKEKQGTIKQNIENNKPLGDQCPTEGDWFDQVIQRVECLIVESLIKLIEFIETILSNVPI